MPASKNQRSGQRGHKSQAIRDLLKQNFHTPVKEIVSILAGRGVLVTPNFVYLVKSKMKARQRREKRAKAVATGQSVGITNPIELVRRVKELASSAGGLSKLKQLVDIMAE